MLGCWLCFPISLSRWAGCWEHLPVRTRTCPKHLLPPPRCPLQSSSRTQAQSLMLRGSHSRVPPKPAPSQVLSSSLLPPIPVPKSLPFLGAHPLVWTLETSTLLPACSPPTLQWISTQTFEQHRFYGVGFYRSSFHVSIAHPGSSSAFLGTSSLLLNASRDPCFLPCPSIHGLIQHFVYRSGGVF